MTREQLQAAIETGNYTAKISDKDGSMLYINEECVSVDRRLKKAIYCITIDLTDYDVREIERKSLESSISDKKSELAALEIQLAELKKGKKQ